MKKHQMLIIVLYFFAALQMTDAAFWMWSKIYIASHGSFVITPLPIVVCALIGTGIGYWMVQSIFKGIEQQMDAAVDFVLDELITKLRGKEEGAGNE